MELKCVFTERQDKSYLQSENNRVIVRSREILQSINMTRPGSEFLSGFDSKKFRDNWEVTSDQLYDQLLLLVVVLGELAFNFFNKSADIEDFSIGYNFSLAITSL